MNIDNQVTQQTAERGTRLASVCAAVFAEIEAAQGRGDHELRTVLSALYWSLGDKNDAS